MMAARVGQDVARHDTGLPRAPILSRPFLESPMNTGKTLFAQLMDFLPWKTFSRIIARYDATAWCEHSVAATSSAPWHSLN